MPALQEKKRICDMHTNLCERITSEVKRRQIDELNSFEEELMQGSLSAQDRQGILAYLSNKTERDKS